MTSSKRFFAGWEVFGVNRSGGGLGLAPSTAKKYHHALRALWKTAIRRQWFTPDSGKDPWAECALPRSLRSAREDRPKAFSVEEVAALLQAAPQEWRFPILLGGFAGLRLGDAVEITWDSIDLYRGLLTYECEKTRTRIVVPIAEPLREELARTPAGERRGAVSPLAGRPRSSLCRSFRRVLQRAGLEGQGLSFHGLRRFFVTSLQQAAMGAKPHHSPAGNSPDQGPPGHRETTLTMEALHEAVDRAGFEAAKSKATPARKPMF